MKNFLSKNWPLLAIVLVAALVFFLLKGNSFGQSTGADNQAKYGDLQSNSGDFNDWGLTVNFAPDYKSVNIRAQGNGNATEFNWTRQRDTQFHYTGPVSIGQLSEIPFNHDLYSADADFALNIRSVEYAMQLQYCVISIWDPSANPVDPENPQLSKAAIQVNWTEKKIVIVKSAPQVGKKG